MQKPALLLLHGICNNFNLFAAPDGLGKYLQEYFDIFPYNYPITAHRSEPWDFDFHLNRDMPKIWESVVDQAGCKPYVLGYSMGGMLAMAAQATKVIDAAGIITVGSPFSFYEIPIYPPLMRAFVKFNRLTGYRTVPTQLLGRFLCAMFTATRSKEMQRDLKLFRYHIKNSTVNVPVETFIQALMWISKRSLTDRTGKIDYVEQFKNIKVPVCLVYGGKDKIAPKHLVEPGYQTLETRRKLLVAINDGTHLNMTSGKQAQKIAKIAAAWCHASDL